jgi:formylmethanofuran dehydrogenase subunit A
LNAKHLFKSGVQVVSDHEIASNGNKRTLWVNARANENPQVMRDIKEKFLRYYTVTLNNYEVTGHYLRNPHVIEVDATQ